MRVQIKHNALCQSSFTLSARQHISGVRYMLSPVHPSILKMVRDITKVTMTNRKLRMHFRLAPDCYKFKFSMNFAPLCIFWRQQWLNASEG